MRDQIRNTLGDLPTRCGDGSSGTMVPTSCSLTNLRPDGFTFQIEVSVWRPTPDKVNTPQSTFIIIISIPSSMKIPEPKEVSKELTQANSFQRVNSAMRTNGDEKYHETYQFI